MRSNQKSKSRMVLFITISALLILLQARSDGESLRVMSFNIWGGGEAGGQPLDQTVEVIEAAKASIVGLQEKMGGERNGQRRNAARWISEKLAWHCLDQDDGPAIVSRYPIVGHTPSKLGAAIELPSGQRLWVFNVHLAHAPYQPYQLLKIPYGDAPFIDTSEQAVDEARKARGPQVAALIREIRAVRPEGCPIAITGDFNEPSALDWTAAVNEARRCPAVVCWPATKALFDAGFCDAYRTTHPDVLKWPGYTWTSITAEDDPQDRHDRIDFVFVGGADVSVEKCEVVGERPQRADIVVTPYPSDHRAVVAEIKLRTRSDK